MCGLFLIMNKIDDVNKIKMLFDNVKKTSIIKGDMIPNL